MMALFAAIVVLLLLASAILTAVHDSVFQITRSLTRTLVEEGFDGAANIDAARASKHAVQASVRVTTTVLNLSALALIALTGV